MSERSRRNRSTATDFESSKPVNFVRTIGLGDHSVLFYGDSDAAKNIEFLFLKLGLERGQHAIYASVDEEPFKLEEQMQTFGIDVDKYHKAGLLHSYKVVSPEDDPLGGVHGILEFMKVALAESKPPCRLVGRLSGAMTEDQAARSLDIERYVQAKFVSSLGSVVCSYGVKEFDVLNRGQWMVEELRNHHAAIFVPGEAESSGIGFFMR